MIAHNSALHAFHTLTAETDNWCLNIHCCLANHNFCRRHSAHPGAKTPARHANKVMALMLCRTKNIVQVAVQKRNSEALSAMTFAATLGDVDSMEHLLQRGLLINTADYDGRTTLHLAALEGNVKVLELLLQEGADPNVRDR